MANGTILPPAQPKTAVQSTQNWANLGMAGMMGLITMLWPSGANFMTAHPAFMTTAIAGINILWRTFITKQPIQGIFTAP